MREVLQTRNRAFGPNGVPTTSRQTSATWTDTTSRLPISLGSTNKRRGPYTDVQTLLHDLERSLHAALAVALYEWQLLAAIEGVFPGLRKGELYRIRVRAEALLDLHARVGGIDSDVVRHYAGLLAHFQFDR